MSTDCMRYYEPYGWVIERLTQEFGESRVVPREETDYGNRLDLAIYRSDDPGSDRVIVRLRNGPGEDVNNLSLAEQREWLDRQVVEVRTLFGLTNTTR